MQRIRLTKSEKRILKHLSTHGYDALIDFPRSEVAYSLDTLEHKGLVKSLSAIVAVEALVAKLMLIPKISDNSLFFCNFANIN